MSFKNHYYYDEQNCDFVPVQYDRTERVIYNLSIWILSGVILTGVLIIALSSYIGTPAELALKAENQALSEQLNKTKDALTTLDQQIDNIAKQDNELYRSMLGMEEIPYEERQAGVGGSDPYAEFDVYSSSSAELLKWTSSKIDKLERKIGIQKLSFEEIKDHYNKNREKLNHIPAIKPTPGILLSGFGMRFHPILKYNRMHSGLDFRADIGDPIYTTGNGTIKFTGRKGTLGNIVIVDHGYGFETLYAHLSHIPKKIRSGVTVERGQLIGRAGTTGLSEGPHLHYEIHNNGKPVDPLFYLFADTSPEEYAMFKEISETNNKSLD
ncbi:MAG: M23 family peptidase [Balneolaceae bacterium]|nr:M23 family peptidase [Balneolaceae bacterium]